VQGSQKDTKGLVPIKRKPFSSPWGQRSWPTPNTYPQLILGEIRDQEPKRYQSPSFPTWMLSLLLSRTEQDWRTLIIPIAMLLLGPSRNMTAMKIVDPYTKRVDM
jgi:hypothetical protein